MESIGTTDLADIFGKCRICCLLCDTNQRKNASEKWQSNGEQEVLLTAGLTAHMVESVIFVRILTLEVTIICFFQLAAVVSRHFYIMAFLMELLYLLLHYCICFWGRTAKGSINYKI